MRSTLLALCATLLCTAALAEQPPETPSGWTHGYVLANGIRIHYYRAPASGKQALILAHGSSDDGRCFTALARELEGRYDVILPDARGHGLSDPPGKDDPPDAQVEDLAGLIRELGLEKPILMGHSMGASSAAWLAAKHPNLLSAVILEDPGLLPRANPGGGAGADLDQRRRETLGRNNATFDETVARCMKNTPSWGLEECRLWAPSKLLHHPDNAYRSFGERPPMEELFDKITIPTLILKADAPPDVRKQNEAVAKHLAHGTLVHIDGAGHNVRREQKARLLAALNAFLGTL